MTYVIAQTCVDVLDKACIEECPVDCIYEGERMLYIHPDECVDCGACEPVCPVEAIYYEDDVPEQWKEYYEGQRRLLRGARLARRCLQGGHDRQGPPGRRGAAPGHQRRALGALAAGVRVTLAARLPEYPWDELAPIAEKAHAFPGGAVDLSVGTPVDPVPAVIQDALAAAANAPGYPLTAGTPELRSAAAGWLARSLDVHVDPVSVLPVIGTKEFIAWLPTMLGLGPADTVVYPSLAYPTYDIGARLAGAASVAGQRPGRHALATGPRAGPAAVGELAVEPDRAGAAGRHAARRRRVGAVAGRVLASDECYIELGWDADPVSVLHESVRGASP